MKTHLSLVVLTLSLALGTTSAQAQRLFVRGNLSAISASDGPFDTTTGGLEVAGGAFADSAEHHEFSLSAGSFAWAESKVRGYTPNDTAGTTRIRLHHESFDIPTSVTHFSFANEQMRLSDGTTYATEYRPDLAICPFLANYRFYIGEKDARVRFYVGGGAGYAYLRAESRLWKTFQRGRRATQSDSDWSFIWNVGAGVSVKVMERLRLDGGLAYQEIGGTTFRMPNITYKVDDLQTGTTRFSATWLF